MSNGRPHGGIGFAHIPGRGIRTPIDMKREMEEERRRRRAEEDRRDERALKDYENMSDEDRRKVSEDIDNGRDILDAIDDVVRGIVKTIEDWFDD